MFHPLNAKIFIPVKFQSFFAFFLLKFCSFLLRMRSTTQDSYYQTDLGRGQGDPMRQQGDPTNGLEKIFSRAFHLAISNSWSVWSDQYPNFSLFDLANTHILVGWVWSAPTFKAKRCIQKKRSPVNCINIRCFDCF